MIRKYLFILCLFTFVFALEEQIYSTIQMMDQVGIIDTENNQIENMVETVE